MRGGTVQINWHGSEPVLSCDFHSLSGLLATGGADHDIKLWVLASGVDQKRDIEVTYKSNLSCHSSAVNALRFSPSGDMLASGADGGELTLWKSQTADAGEVWKVFKSLLSHRKDVLDIQWSSDGLYLLSGSVDNSCIIWDAQKGSVLQILDAHSHYVQGVAWDPLGKYVSSLSADRTLRIYISKPSKTKGIRNTNFVCQDVVSKMDLQTNDDSKTIKCNLFHDETLPSFFRRLAWSPDGAFVVTPAGSCKISLSSEPVNFAFIFSRKDFSRPSVMLPCSSKPFVAIRFCPIKFHLRGTNTSPIFKLPYRLIFAAASLDSLYVYDTESNQPILVVAGAHYAAITDIAWSSNAKYLAATSRDGYCTILEFEENELGSPWTSAEQETSRDTGKTVINLSTEGLSVANTRETVGTLKQTQFISEQEIGRDTGNTVIDLSMDNKPEENASEGVANVKDDDAKEATPQTEKGTKMNVPKKRVTPFRID